MNLTVEQLLLAHDYLEIQGSLSHQSIENLILNRELVTIINNFNYYGFMPSQEACSRLLSLNPEELAKFWTPIEVALKELTADNRKMDDFVVYQNFPKEVLSMDWTEYWGKQILMYWGFDKKFFVEKKTDRPALSEKTNLKVLHLADDETLYNIYQSLLQNKTRWSDSQREHLKFLLTNSDAALGASFMRGIKELSMDKVSFRENGIQAMSYLLDHNPDAWIGIDDATDVLRLAALRSEADVSLRQPIKFKSFSRKERRFLCQMLENSKNLESDLAERPGLWKLLLRRLHPGDLKSLRLSAAYNQLYLGKLKSFASQVEAGIITENLKVLTLLQNRPGDFARRLHKLYAVFGNEAISSFTKVMDRLSNHQLVKLLKYLETIGTRKTLTYPPKGNWSRLQISENNKKLFSAEALTALRQEATSVIKLRLKKLVPEGFDVDAKTSFIKLQTNDQELASYGRGTVFEIPKQMMFLRSASYWENDSKQGVTWFDNGWNFFNDKWEDQGSVCWNAPSFGGQSTYNRYSSEISSDVAAIFSGDPVNSGELKGRATQMVDLYLDKLIAKGVRYAVWNILCFSKVAFEDATGEVLATLQMGEKPEEGKLYEPSRAAFIFPLKGKSLTKYIAFIDLEKRQLTYLDANLKGSVSSASSNGGNLSKQMPAFLEYLESLPSVADLLAHADKGTTPVVYTDKDREIKDQQSAYVFKPENDSNQFQKLDLEKLL